MNAAEFRRAMALLPEPPSDSRPPQWSYWRHDLWDRAQQEPVENFMAWPAVYATMLVDHFSIKRQLEYLSIDWKRWGSVVSDDGNDSNQRNLINQAAHLRLWEQAAGRNIADVASIFEFGAGYGAMALVLRRAGFRGCLYTHDLPEFTLLQQWWMDQQGIGADVLPQSGPVEAELFIGLYSISEIPVEQREKWLRADNYLLLYSSRFADFDNLAWARQVIAARPGLNWHEAQMEQRPDYYLIGWQKNYPTYSSQGRSV